jgi:hypothetical protein
MSSMVVVMKRCPASSGGTQTQISLLPRTTIFYNLFSFFGLDELVSVSHNEQPVFHGWACLGELKVLPLVDQKLA